MAEDEKMKKLRESVEKNVPSPKAHESEQAGGARPEEMERIIERLRSKEKEKAGAASGVHALEDSRLAELKARIEGRATMQKIDFSRASFAEASKKQAFLSDGTLSAIGNFYAFFEWPVTAVASFFSRLPFATSLESDLAAANLPISAESYLVAASVFSIILSVLVMVFSFVLSAIFAPHLAFIAAPLSLAAFSIMGVLSLFYPSQVAKERAEKINRELPFALRHLSSQIRAGVSFHRALKSVANAEYGLLSIELRHVLRDLDKGSSTEAALLALVSRTKSQGLRKATVQIIRALKTGGNLSQIIGNIAEDVSFESRMLVRDFVEMLNIVSVMYIMIGVVAPVIINILSAVTQLPLLGISIPFPLVALVFTLNAFAMFGMVLVIKRMEPAM